MEMSWVLVRIKHYTSVSLNNLYPALMYPLQVPALPVRASSLPGLVHAAAVLHAGQYQPLLEVGRDLGADQAERAAGCPQPSLVDQHDQPVRVDLLLRISGSRISFA